MIINQHGRRTGLEQAGIPAYIGRYQINQFFSFLHLPGELWGGRLGEYGQQGYGRRDKRNRKRHCQGGGKVRQS